ncbi:MAG: His/Gly/Thr/Pro-type tRNA ligase C-terminal domain-containing protein, partial [Patescibacteria group bacterium]
PERFDLTCVNEKGEKERIVMIHAAIMGSFERFLSVIIEHTGGVFPTWLSPVQAIVLPISEKHLEYGKGVCKKLIENGIRAEIDESNETLGKKVRDAKMQKIPYLLVVGDKEVESKEIAVESRIEKLGSIPLDKFLNKIKGEIENRN